MKIRLMGTQKECERLTALFAESMTLGNTGSVRVLEVSEFYLNRGTSALGRVYVELRLNDAGDRPNTNQRPVES